MALFGNRWTSQFGEEIDCTGQWSQTLQDVTSEQVIAALEAIQVSGREWPPTAPEFRAMCIGRQRVMLSPPAAYAEAIAYQRGEITIEQLDPLVRHTILKNLDAYQFKRLALDKAQDAFRFAYKATQDQVAAGKTLYRLPDPAPMLMDGSARVTPEEAEQARRRLFEILDEMKTEPAPKTQADIDDEQRLERIKNAR